LYQVATYYFCNSVDRADVVDSTDRIDPADRGFSAGGLIGGFVAATAVITIATVVIVVTVLYCEKKKVVTTKRNDEGVIYEEMDGYHSSTSSGVTSQEARVSEKRSENSGVPGKCDKATKCDVLSDELDLSTNNAYGCAIHKSHSVVSYFKSDANGKDKKKEFEHGFDACKEDKIYQNEAYSATDDSIYYT